MKPRWTMTLAVLALVAVLIALASPAEAIPAFARKYGTSCVTCHVVYPKLTPFGEAFRRNGYRFPGVDSDFVKQETVSMGQESYKKVFPNAVWPSWIPVFPPIAIGVNGQAVVHPDKSAGGTKADNGTQFSLNDLVAEGHLWAGGSLDDAITLWAEVTFSGDGVDLEHAQVLFEDLIGPPHALNIVLGRGFSTISPFGPHSSFIADEAIPVVPVTVLFGATSDPWDLLESFNGAELNGVLGGRLGYSLGINAGANIAVRPTENVYGNVAYKIGGMRLDGEGSSGAEDAAHPWAETSLTLYGFGYHSNSRYSIDVTSTAEDGTPTTASVDRQDVAWTAGGGGRGQVGSAELNGGYYVEGHSRATADARGVTAQVGFGELSYVLFPWLVPALRIQNVILEPDGALRSSDLQILPGVACLVRANVRVVVTVLIERAHGAPDGGWEPAGGSALPTSSTQIVHPEVEAITATLAWAF